MRFTEKSLTNTKEILWNDHYVAETYDCSALTALATDNIIPAGTIIPANDASAIGVLLWDVELNKNPNGTIVVHGFINKSKLPAEPAETVNLPMIKFVGE